MSDPNWLLSTLAQSTAAIVAIVGGFLVSRLVQLSSEREGLRRQFAAATDERKHVIRRAEDANRNRLTLSGEIFQDWVLGDVVDAWPNPDSDALLHESNIPRGSNQEEMAPFLNQVIETVDAAILEVKKYVHDGDDSRLDLDDLIERGLRFGPSDREVFEQVAYRLHHSLPEPQVSLGAYGSMPMPLLDVRMPPITSGMSARTSSRRLDDATRDEQELSSRAVFLDVDIQRLTREIETIGKPVGVTAAVWILGIYAALGIVAPVVVMAFLPQRIEQWLAWLLVVLFTLALLLVVLYIAWYARQLGQRNNGGRQ